MGRSAVVGLLLLVLLLVEAVLVACDRPTELQVGVLRVWLLGLGESESKNPVMCARPGG